jgi:hypothetical protein
MESTFNDNGQAIRADAKVRMTDAGIANRPPEARRFMKRTRPPA